MAQSIALDTPKPHDPSHLSVSVAHAFSGRGGDEARGALDDVAAQLLATGARAVAAEQGLAFRTFQRRMSECGTTPRTLVQRLRRERALHLLATAMPLADVARALVFSGTISLARFCRREFEATAGQLRGYLIRRETTSRIRCTRCGTKC